MITWKIGTPVVCVKNFRGVNKFGGKLDFTPPKKNVVYAYDGTWGYDDFYSCWYIHLKEYNKPKRFNSAHFRPVKEVMDEWTEELTKELEQEIEQEIEVEVLIK